MKTPLDFLKDYGVDHLANPFVIKAMNSYGNMISDAQRGLCRKELEKMLNEGKIKMSHSSRCKLEMAVSLAPKPNP